MTIQITSNYTAAAFNGRNRLQRFVVSFSFTVARDAKGNERRTLPAKVIMRH